MRISDWSSDVCSSDLLQLDVDGIAVREVAIEDQPCQRIFDQRLDRALQWPRTVHRIEAGLGELVERGIAERQRDAAFDKAPDEALRLDAGDRTDLCRTEWVKDHRLVDTIDELGSEVQIGRAHV